MNETDCGHAEELSSLRIQVAERERQVRVEWLLRSRYQHRVDALELALVALAKRDKAMQEEIAALTKLPDPPQDDVALAV